VHGSADAEPYATSGEVVDDVSGVGQGSGESVELGDGERVDFPAGGERLAETGAVAVGAGQPVVDVSPLRGDAERGERIALCGDVLLVGAAAGIADQQSAHGR
jgi:hypothetical protein